MYRGLNEVMHYVGQLSLGNKPPKIQWLKAISIYYCLSHETSGCFCQYQLGSFLHLQPVVCLEVKYYRLAQDVLSKDNGPLLYMDCIFQQQSRLVHMMVVRSKGDAQGLLRPTPRAGILSTPTYSIVQSQTQISLNSRVGDISKLYLLMDKQVWIPKGERLENQGSSYN